MLGPGSPLGEGNRLYIVGFIATGAIVLLLVVLVLGNSYVQNTGFKKIPPAPIPSTTKSAQQASTTTPIVTQAPPTEVPIVTATPTPTPTPIPTGAPVATPTPTPTPTNTPTPTPTLTPTISPTPNP